MSKQVEQRIVEMEFNNKNFEKNVKTSMSTLDKLKNLLNFGKETKSLEELQRQADRTKFNGMANAVEGLADKFSGLQMAGTLAMYKIANAAVDAGIKLAKSLSTDNIVSGFNKLAEETTAVSTLVSQGYKLDVVENQLDKLNWFTDETSYNFSEMINNIAKFTATGKGLDESVTAMQGIAIWAAASGQNAQKASMAMYQLSQALSAGVMRKEDWKSIQNVNMDTAEFREQALAAGVALKTLKKNADGTYTSLMQKNAKAFKQSQFSEHLTEDAWFTADVMMSVYQNYSKAADGIYDVVNKMEEQFGSDLIAGQIIQAAKAAKEGDEAFEKYAKSLGLSTAAASELKVLTSALDDFGLKNFALAQEYKTFADVVDATQDAVSSKWKAVFKNILGNYEEQKELWTSIGESFYDMFATPVGNLASLTADWKDLGGRTALLEGLGNVVKALGAIIAPVKEAFREIFPPMTAKRLAELTEKFKDFTSKLIIGEKTADKIRQTFKGLFSVIKTITTIIGSLAKAAFNLIGIFIPLGDGILTATAAFGKWLEKTTKVVRDSKIINKVLNGIVNTIKLVVSKLKEFIVETLKFDRIMNFFKSMFNFITKIGLAIGKVFASIIRNGDLKNVMDIFNAGLFGGLLLTVTKLFKNLSEATKNLGETFKGVQGMLSGVKDILAAYTKEINSKTLLNIAKAVALLAASLFILSLIPADKITTSLGALAGVMTEFMLMFKIFTKISGDVIRVGRSSIAMLAMAISITILASALRKMGKLNLKQIGAGLLGMAGSMTILMIALHAMPDGKRVLLKSAGLISMSLAMLIMATALKKMGSIPILDICKGLVAMAGSMTILMVAMNKMPNWSLTKGLAMIPLTLSLLILATALKKLATLSWGDISKSLVVMGGALFILVMAINNLPRWSLIKAIAMIPLTSSLLILGLALKKLAKLSWEDIKKSLTAMGGALAILVASTSIMSKMGAKTGGLLVASAALLLFAVGMKSLAKISWEGILRAFTALAIGITALVVAAHLLSPVAGTLMLVAGAMALFGVAAVAFGIGLILISTGIGALGVALATGATAIVAGLTAIILGLLGLVPEIIKIFGLVLVGLIKIIGKLAPALIKAFAILIIEAAKTLAQYVPELVTIVMDLLINTMRAIADRMPELLASAVELFGSFGKGLLQAIGMLDTKTLLAAVASIGILTVALLLMAALSTLVPAALLGVLAFGALVIELALVIALISKLFGGNGMKDTLATGGEVLMLIGQAIGKFIGGIIGGLGAGITSSMPQIAKNLSEFMKELQPFINGVNGVHPSILVKIGALAGAIMLLSAANFITGIMNILSLGQSLPKLGRDLSSFGESVKPFIDMAITITPNMLKGVNALTGSIVALTAANVLKGVTSFLTGGRNSYAKFGKEIAELGTGMNNFVKNLGTFSNSQVKTIEGACKGLTALAEAGKKIPNEGGVWGWLVGDNSIGKFSEHLPILGKNLNKFISNLGTFSEGQVITIGAAANAITTLAKAGKEIPNEGGVWGWLAGDNSFSKFSEHLPKVGEHLKGFVETLGMFNEAQVTAAKCASEAIVAMASAASQIPNSGGIVSWFTGDNDLAKFGSKLPGVGKNLKEFIQAIGQTQPGSVESVEVAAKAITSLAKAAAEVPNSGGIASWFTGENDFAAFGAKLPDVGKNLKSFVSSLGTFNEAQVTTTDCAGRAITSLAIAAGNIPGDKANWIEAIVGNKNIDTFAAKLPSVGKYLAEFVKELGEFTEAQVTTTDCAGRAISALAIAAGNIPGDKANWLEAIVGDKNIDTFAEKLPAVGTGLAGFAEKLGNFDDSKVTTVEAATGALSALATTPIPTNGGFWSWIAGDDDIKKFAEKLPSVGTALGQFIKNIGTFGQGQIDTTNAAVNAMKALANFGSVDTKKVKEVLTAITSHLSSFGTNLSNFAKGMTNVSVEDLTTAIEKMNTVIDLAKSVANISVDSLNTFGDSLEKIGTESITKFIEAFSDERPKDKAVNAITDIINKMITAMESKRKDISDKMESMFNSAVNTINSVSFLAKATDAGKYFAQGFANGIINNKHLAVDAGTTLGNAAYNATKRAIDAHSPSKKAFQLGGFYGQGFVNAIVSYGRKVYNESYEMGTSAIDGLNKGISTMDDLIGTSMDGEPTIRPVLDLTDIQNGAKSIAGMFNNPNLGTNLNAISVGMRNRQNGSNNDIISALDKLGSNISGSGDTYNINGVTYDNGSEISEAVGVLIRAAEVKRRA